MKLDRKFQNFQRCWKCGWSYYRAKSFISALYACIWLKSHESLFIIFTFYSYRLHKRWWIAEQKLPLSPTLMSLWCLTAQNHGDESKSNLGEMRICPRWRWKYPANSYRDLSFSSPIWGKQLRLCFRCHHFANYYPIYERSRPHNAHIFFIISKPCLAVSNSKSNADMMK